MKFYNHIILKLFSSIFLIWFAILFVKGQDIPSSSEKIVGELIPNNILSRDFVESIPTLFTMIDSAEVNSPLLSHNATEVMLFEREIKTERRRILENIALESSFKYGLFDYFYLAESSATSIREGYISSSEQFLYSAGITLRLPIFKWYNRKNQIQIAELKREMSIDKLEETKQQIRKLIISEYNELLSQHKILLLRNQEVISTEILVLMGENQFKNGEITTEELTRYKSTFLQAQIDFEIAQKDLITTYLILEDITGFKF